MHSTSNSSCLCGELVSAPGAGSASKGLYRVHQFSKVEMFILGTEEQSESLLAELCNIEEDIFTELGLHYRMLVIASPHLCSLHSASSQQHCQQPLW